MLNDKVFLKTLSNEEKLFHCSLQNSDYLNFNDDAYRAERLFFGTLFQKITLVAAKKKQKSHMEALLPQNYSTNYVRNLLVFSNAIALTDESLEETMTVLPINEKIRFNQIWRAHKKLGKLQWSDQREIYNPVA